MLDFFHDYLAELALKGSAFLVLGLLLSPLWRGRSASARATLRLGVLAGLAVLSMAVISLPVWRVIPPPPPLSPQELEVVEAMRMKARANYFRATLAEQKAEQAKAAKPSKPPTSAPAPAATTTAVPEVQGSYGRHGAPALCAEGQVEWRNSAGTPG